MPKANRQKPTARPGFNRLAPVYDQLAALVFGRAIHRIQNWLTAYVPAQATMLIVGGGTGQVLEYLAQTKPGIKVHYLDISDGMIAQAQKRDYTGIDVHFQQGTVEDILASAKFDVVMTPFFLDVFTQEELATIISRLSSHLHDESLWLHTDFQYRSGLTGFFQHVLIWCMYRFFRFSTKISARKLHPPQAFFKSNRMRPLHRTERFGGMIYGEVWGKV